MPTEKQSIVILADGDYPTAQYPLEILAGADTLICCDASVLKLQGREPDYIVGDMDTLGSHEQQKYNNIIHKCSCQETNDLTKAFSFALGLIPQGSIGKIHILGATGGREDHTLGNISLLLEYTKNYGNSIAPFGNLMHNGISVDIITDNGIFTPHHNSFEMNCKKGDQISIFAFDSTIQIESKGLLYPLDNVVFDLWWKATLNECSSDKFTLTFSHSAPVLLFRAF